jgi:hypothetical protein
LLFFSYFPFFAYSFCCYSLFVFMGHFIRWWQSPRHRLQSLRRRLPVASEIVC